MVRHINIIWARFNWIFNRIFLVILGLFSSRTTVSIDWFQSNLIVMIPICLPLVISYSVPILFPSIPRKKKMILMGSCVSISIVLLIVDYLFVNPSIELIIFMIVANLMYFGGLFLKTKNEKRKLTLLSTFAFALCLLSGGSFNTLCLPWYWYMMIASLSVTYLLKEALLRGEDGRGNKLFQRIIIVNFVLQISILIEFYISIIIWVPLIYSVISQFKNYKELFGNFAFTEIVQDNQRNESNSHDNKSIKWIDRSLFGQLSILFLFGF